MGGPDLGVFLWTVAGVLAAVLFPILAAAVKREFPARVVGSGMPPWVRKYAILFIYAALASLAGLAIWISQNPDEKIPWFTAFLIGFGAEAAIEKFLNPVV